MTHGGLRIYETFDRHLKTIDYEGKDYKEHLFAVADFVLELNKKARMFGILALEENLYYDNFCPSCYGSMEKFLFAQLTRMLIDGYDDDHLSDFARNYIYSIDVNLLL